MSAIGRRIRWFATGFGHLAPQQRPRYKKSVRSVAESIAKERRQAAAEQRRKAKKR
jgi:hypothetical protein